MMNARHYRGKSLPISAVFSVRKCFRVLFRATCGSPKRRVLANLLFLTIHIAKGRKATRNSPRRLSRMPRNALGRGLGALIREAEPPTPAAQTPTPATSAGTAAAPARGAMAAGPQQRGIHFVGA